MYIDIHTHRIKPHRGVLSVVNVYEDFTVANDLHACSVGLHPWYLHDFEPRWEQLQQIATKSNVLAIGECGLDKVTVTPWQAQLVAFRRQVALAQKVEKPLVIHCVRAFSEVLSIIAEQNITVPVIFHGFNKSEQLASRLLSLGYYLSFGAGLLKGARLSAFFKTVPLHQVFLETDDAPQDIALVYSTAALIRETSEEHLILQLQQNFKTVFNQ